MPGECERKDRMSDAGDRIHDVKNSKSNLKYQTKPQSAPFYLSPLLNSSNLLN